jgi:tetratricopeptide (TPR) repeat protein
MEVVRKDLLQDALRFYQEFLKENSTDPSLRLETGHAWRRSGDMRLYLSDFKGAEADYSESISLLGQLAKESPEQRHIQAALAQSHRHMSRVLRKTGRQQEAEKTLRRALELQKDLVARHPDMLDYQYQVLVLEGSIGLVYVESRRYVEAESALRAALALGRELDRKTQLTREQPELHYQYLQGSIEGMTALGHVLRATKRPEDAEKVYDEAFAMMDKLLAVNPSRPWNRSLHANLLEGRGHALLALGRREQGIDAFRKAVAIDEKLAADFPTVERYQKTKTVRANYLKKLEKK